MIKSSRQRLYIGINALVKEPPESFAPSTTWRHSNKITIYKPRGRLSPDTESIIICILSFPDSRTMTKKFMLFKMPNIFCLFVLYSSPDGTRQEQKQKMSSCQELKVRQCLLGNGPTGKLFEWRNCSVQY